MKRLQTILIVLAIMLMSSSIFAQEKTDNNETQYLLSNVSIGPISGFGGPLVEFSSMGGKFAVSNGGGGAVIFNQKFFFGGYGLGLSNNFYKKYPKDAINWTNYRVNFGHGGFWLGYLNKSNKVIHWGFSTKIGWGELSLTEQDFNSDIETVENDQIFVLTPQVEMEMNITTWFKMNYAIGYRLTTGIDNTAYYKKSDYNSPQATISLLFGGFSRRK